MRSLKLCWFSRRRLHRIVRKKKTKASDQNNGQKNERRKRSLALFLRKGEIVGNNLKRNRSDCIRNLQETSVSLLKIFFGSSNMESTQL